jgi:hypothetical protein
MMTKGDAGLARGSRLAVEQLESREAASGLQPTGAEQYMLERINDIRANPAAYGAAIGVDLSGVAPAPPLAFDPVLVQASRLHAVDMNSQGYVSQITPQGFDPGARLTQLGFAWTSWLENNAAGPGLTDSPSAIKSLIVSPTPATQSARDQLLVLDAFARAQQLVGIGIVQNGGGTQVNYYTIDTASTSNSKPYLTGVVYNDANNNGHYDVNEGLGGIQITATPVATNSTSTGNGTAASTPTTNSTTTSATTTDNTTTSATTTNSTGTSTPTTTSATTGTTTSSTSTTDNTARGATTANGTTASATTTGTTGTNTTTTGSTTAGTTSAGSTTTSASSTGSAATGTTTTSASTTGSTASSTTTTGSTAGSTTTSSSAPTFTTTTFDSGGYTLQLDPGTYTVTASGGALTAPITQTVEVTNINTRLNFVVPGSTPQSADAPWAQLIYHDLLNRPATSTEVDNVVQKLATGGSTQVVLQNILQGQEYTDTEVTSWYEHYLNRAPTSQELVNAASQLQSGTSTNSVRSQILTSSEFYSLAGGTASGFVVSLYQDLLGRTPQGHESDSWVTQATSGDTAGVVNGILGSVEYQTDVVNAAYASYLRRGPDGPGKGFFMGELANNTDQTMMIEQFLTSSEYHNNAADVLWLRRLYLDVLGRDGDPHNELSSWLSLLESGQTHSTVAAQILSSNEPYTNLVAQLYNGLLGRAPDAPGAAFMLSDLQANGQSARVVADIIGSSEYFNLHGADNTKWVQSIYQNLLGRPATDAEVQTVLASLSSGTSRAAVASQFTTSAAYQQNFVREQYNFYLRRSPTTTERDASVALMQGNSTDAQVVAQILSSDEYYKAAESF